MSKVSYKCIKGFTDHKDATWLTNGKVYEIVDGLFAFDNGETCIHDEYFLNRTMEIYSMCEYLITINDNVVEINYKQIVDNFNEKVKYINWYFSYETFYGDGSNIHTIYLTEKTYDHRYLLYSSGLNDYYNIKNDEELIRHIMNECSMIKDNINTVINTIVDKAVVDINRIVDQINEMNRIGE